MFFKNVPHLGFLHLLYVFPAQEEDQVSAAEDMSDAPISEFEAFAYRVGQQIRPWHGWGGATLLKLQFGKPLSSYNYNNL